LLSKTLVFPGFIDCDAVETQMVTFSEGQRAGLPSGFDHMAAKLANITDPMILVVSACLAKNCQVLM
jgi:hypothetical protein